MGLNEAAGYVAVSLSALAAAAILAGVTADLFGVIPAIATVGILTAVSGLVVAVRMRETLPRPNPRSFA